MPTVEKSIDKGPQAAYPVIPVIAYSHLYDLIDPRNPKPKKEKLIARNGAVEVFYVGKHEKGKMYIFKPKVNGDITVHFDHRSICNPIQDQGIYHPNIPLLEDVYESLDEREDTYITMDNYMRDPGMYFHRMSQDFIRDYAELVSYIIDPSRISLTHPRAFLEVGFDMVTSTGVVKKIPIDIILATHGSNVIMTEVASRTQDKEEKDLDRTPKYKQIVKSAAVAKTQLPENLTIVKACMFYERLSDESLYLSLRYPRIQD